MVCPCYTLKKAVAVLGSRALPSKRTALGRALAAWRADLLRDLGGEDAVSTQQAAVIELAVRTKLLLDSIDAWLLVRPPWHVVVFGVGFLATAPVWYHYGDSAAQTWAVIVTGVA